MCAAKVLEADITGLGARTLRGFDWLYSVHREGDPLVDLLCPAGGGFAGVATRSGEGLRGQFRPYDGMLPGLCSRDPHEPL